MLCAVITATTLSGLHPRALEPVPTGSVTPKGWLRKQLELQADGLSGHLSLFWDDVMESVWIGGHADDGLHERAPYWLNGVVPLAFLLQNAGASKRAAVSHTHGPTFVHNAQRASGNCTYGIDMKYSDISLAAAADAPTCEASCVANNACVAYVFANCSNECWLKSSVGATSSASCRCFGTVPAKPVDIMAQAEKYVKTILAAQSAEGWLGPPVAAPTTDGDQYWGPSNVLFSLWQYAEGSLASATDGAKGLAAFRNATGAMLRHLLVQKKRMATAKLTSWSQQRWIDQALSAEFLIDHAELAGVSDADVASLLSLVDLLHTQGVDWETWFAALVNPSGNQNHNVNSAQGLKSAAVYWRYSGNETLPALSEQRMAVLDAKVGLPTGMFNGDELIPSPNTRSPSRGIEVSVRLCTVTYYANLAHNLTRSP